MSAWLIVWGALLCVTGGLVALALPATPRAQRITAFLQVFGAITGLAGCVAGLRGVPADLTLPWQVPMAAALVHVDALSYEEWLHPHHLYRAARDLRGT